MTVYELTRDQLEELKEIYWCDNNEEAQYYYASPDEIPDFVVQDWYSGITFVNNDFWCTAD